MPRSSWWPIACASAALILVSAVAAVAQEETEEEKKEIGKWYNTAEAGLNLTQASYSDNWKGGENSSVAWSVYFDATAENQFSPFYNWFNTLKLAYGQSRQQERDENGDRVWRKSEKSLDKIDFETILRMTRGWALDPYLSARFESLFQDVSDPLDRRLWFNPMTFKESAGVSHKFINARGGEEVKEGEEFFTLLRLGFTARQTYRRFFTDQLDVNNKDTDAGTSNDGGTEFIVDLRQPLSERLTWTSKLTIYKPFWWSANDAFDQIGADSLAAAGIDTNVRDYTTATDIGWENTFSTNVTKYISFNLYVEFVYDKYDNTVVPIVASDGSLENAGAVSTAVRKKGQYKQTFSVGISYRFL